MIRNKKIVILLMVIAIVCLAIFGFNYFINEKNQQEKVDENTVGKAENDKENEQIVQTFEEGNMQEDINTNKETNPFYFIYMVQNDGTPETSFISKTLNPSYRYDSDVKTSVSFDDNGKVIEDNKMILIQNYKISEENKQKIKSIAGEKNYEKAIKEIKERVKETKETNFN